MGASWAVLKASWEVLGRSWRRIRGVLEAPLGRLGAVLGAWEAMLEPSGGQKAPQMEPKRIPNRAPEATRVENCKTLIFNDGTKDFNDFVPQGSFLAQKMVPKWVPNRIIDAEGVRKPLERHLCAQVESKQPMEDCIRDLNHV